jgi:triacylglycerol lipase
MRERKSGTAVVRNAGIAACLVALAGLGATLAFAQTPAELADIAAKVGAMGPVVDPPNTAKLYIPFQQKEPYASVQVLRDLKYGTDDKQALDLFAPPPLTSGARPVLIFVRGGAYLAGDKRAPGSPFYDNVMLWAVKNGMIGVNINYRLAPANPWPAGAEDVAAAVNWVKQNIAPYGGDPARVFLMGHSAGAVHVASYAAHPEFYGPYGLGLAGIILVSGAYDLTTAEIGPPEKAYFGDDQKLYAERSSLAGLTKLRVPIFFSHGGIDPPTFVQQAAELREALCKEGSCAPDVLVPKHAHMSEIYSVNTTDTSLTGPVMEFIKKTQ